MRKRLEPIYLAVLVILQAIVSSTALSTPTSRQTSLSSSAASSSSRRTSSTPHFVLLGGLGRIGTAVAEHLLLREPSARLTLVARSRRRRNDNAAAARLHDDCRVSIAMVDNIWSPLSDDNNDNNNHDLLQDLIDSCDCVIHTAGPYYPEQPPTVLQRVLRSEQCQVYVDVADPVDYLKASISYHDQAIRQNKTCLLAAGAFPGMSNVLAMEATASLLLDDNEHDDKRESPIHNVYFQYFTSGLGGSGTVNLYITNLGFGDSMQVFRDGALRTFESLSGRLLGTVNFGHHDDDNIVGTRQVFAWPFPEAATVAHALNITGNSIAAMGTAPDVWNDMLGVLVALVPRPWWKSRRFSQFMADFSQPLVWLTDAYLRLRDTQYNTGETHAMRIDVARRDKSGVSIVQGHESFRQCVGQSCAEFALDCLNNAKPGVYLPEQLYRDDTARRRIIEKLTTTPGTLYYSGPVARTSITGPTKLDRVLQTATFD